MKNEKITKLPIFGMWHQSNEPLLYSHTNVSEVWGDKWHFYAREYVGRDDRTGYIWLMARPCAVCFRYINKYWARFEVLTAASMKIAVFWVLRHVV
jgi:hypothetical protein